jgi:hypothetical protein
MCMRCLKEGMRSDNLANAGLKQRPRWCPTGEAESWWVETIFVESLAVPVETEIDSGAYLAAPSCQLRYCYSQPVLLCTPCCSQFLMVPQTRSLSSRSAFKRESMLQLSDQTHIPQSEPPCWLVIPNWNESFLHHASLLKAMSEEGLTVWSFDPRAQGLSESPASSECLSLTSLDTYATDLKCVLTLMQSSLPPGTRINILAMGLLADVLQEKRHLWGGDDDDDGSVDRVVLVRSRPGGWQWQLRLPSGLLHSLSSCWRRGGGMLSHSSDASQRRADSSRKCGEAEAGRVVVTDTDKDTGTAVRIRIHVPPCLAILILTVQEGVLSCLHAGLSLRILRRGGLIRRGLITVTSMVASVVSVLWLPGRVGVGVMSRLKAMQQWLKVGTLAPLSKWLHDTPSLVVISGDSCSFSSSSCASARPMGQWTSLHRRYPFLQSRAGSVAWYQLLGGRIGGGLGARGGGRVRWVDSDVRFEQVCGILSSSSS